MNNLKIIREATDAWYLPLIFGLISIFTGLYCTFSSEDSFLFLSRLIGFSMLFSSLAELYVTFSKIKEGGSWQGPLILGFTQLALALVLVSRPEITFSLLAVFIAILVFIRSLNAIVTSFELRAVGIKDWWSLLIFGALGVFLAYLLISNPKLAGKGVAFWIGVSFILLGVFSVFLALKFRKLKKVSKNIGSELQSKWNAINNEINLKLKD